MEWYLRKYVCFFKINCFIPSFKIERLIPVANEIEKKRLDFVLSKRTYHKISDEHLWYSIFFRSTSTTFTRVQRCTCCFVLLFLSMFLNIMYYDLSNQSQNSTMTITVGPMRISSEQVCCILFLCHIFTD